MCCWEQECEPAVGRLLVFSVEGQGAERKVNLVAEVETRGAVYVLNGFNGKLLAGINSKVCTLFLALSLRGAHSILVAVFVFINFAAPFLLTDQGSRKFHAVSKTSSVLTAKISGGLAATASHNLLKCLVDTGTAFSVG